MATDIPMPSYSDNMEEADLIGWLVAPGDFVHEGDPIAEIETDKATGELESPVSGTLVEICVPEGTTGVKVGSVVARIDAAEPPSDELAPPNVIEGAAPETASTAAELREADSRPAEPIESPSAPPPPETPTATATEALSTAPAATSAVTALARRVAAQSGLDLSELQGTGAHGRITKADVEAAASTGALRGPRALSVLDVDCNVSKALDVCRQATDREDRIEIELVVFAVRAAVLALNEVPGLAARGESGENGFGVRVHSATEAPRTLREAERKSLAVLARELHDDPEETTEPPDIEIFDFGELGIHRVQTAVAAGAALGIGAPRPSHAGGGLDRASFTLSVDTSRVELATAARWFSEFRRRIEDPLEMLL